MKHIMNDNAIAAGTTGGTLLAFFGVTTNAVIATVILAAIGAAISFMVSLALKELVKFIKNWKNGQHINTEDSKDTSEE